MDYSFVDLLALLGSVCLFLYGMKIMSEGLQKTAGSRLRSILAWMTKNRFLAIITGIVITALIQSSSASVSMVVSFVNAGLMPLEQSLAVSFGAALGTTFTEWIIAIFGFKVKMSAFLLPLLAFAVPMLFIKRNNYKNIGELLIGFAFLFMGLDAISANVPDLSKSPEVFASLQQYTSMGFLSILFFTLVGWIVTMVIQSSAATFAIVLIMAAKGWISFDIACAMVLGDNIFYGNGFSKALREAVHNAENNNRATVFGYYVNDPERFGIVEFDEDGKVVSIEEKPQEPKSNYAVTGLYFYPSGVSKMAESVRPSERGELEITTLNDMYLQDKKLDVQLLGRGFAWLDTGTVDSLVDAADFVRMIEKRQGIKISAPEEIAYKNGWITKKQLLESAQQYGKSPYGKHLRKVADNKLIY